jgi:hypothetical protein
LVHALPASDADAPADFLPEALALFRVVACGNDAPLPPGLDAATVEAHCTKVKGWMERYRKSWGSEGRDFLKALQPADLPGEAVCLFCGGDLLGALTTYPSEHVITTVSLELAGDPRRLGTLSDPKALKASLDFFRDVAASTWLSMDSKSVNLSKAQRGELPGQLSMFLLALATHGQRPVGLRYFRLEPDGAVHYLSAKEIAAADGEKAKSLKATWKSPDFSPAFANVELAFVPKDAPEGTAPHLQRHLAVNLGDDALPADSPFLKHLAAKGKVAMMAKAASYLLWRNDFSRIRDAMLASTDFIISDSTGVPPYFAKRAGFVQDAYGQYETSFLGANAEHNADLRKLFETAKPLRFRYGYPDGSARKLSHLIVTRRAK